jgi:hypothetical protein
MNNANIKERHPSYLKNKKKRKKAGDFLRKEKAIWQH